MQINAIYHHVLSLYFSVKIINLLFPNLYKANKLLTLMSISLNSSRRPREEANRRPRQRNQYSIIINIIIVHLFFCGLSVDLV